MFDYNTLVSSRALETIWNKDSIETEELLMGKQAYRLYRSQRLESGSSISLVSSLLKYTLYNMRHFALAKLPQ